MIDSLLSAIASGATVVTANKRLARSYRLLYEARQREAKAAVWAEPFIVPWGVWVRGLWAEAVLAGRMPPAVLLNRDHCEAVWRAIIERSGAGQELLQLRAAALSAMSAWKLLHEYRVPWKRITYAGHDDWTAFTGWARSYEQACAAGHWIDEPQLGDLVREGMAAGRVQLAHPAVFGGFDEFSPAQQAILDALGGCAILPPPAQDAATPSRLEAPDRVEELRASAMWARSCLDLDQRARVGVVIPDLAAVRGTVQRIFTEVFHPEAVSRLARVRPAFHISIGRPLAEYPIVHAALSILRMTVSVMTMGACSALLRSPFIAGAREEAAARAQADVRLRRGRPAEVTMASLRKQLLGSAESVAGTSPLLAAALERWDHVRQSLPPEQTATSWAESFRALLDALGWPGGETPDSHEYQTLEAWESVLDRFSTLDLVSGPFSRDAALQRIAEMAAAADFQPEDRDAPVQITGVLEAAGAAFDHLWTAGLDDDAWPPPPRPHPFLPPGLQIQYTMPHCSAERELDFAGRMTARLIRSAPDVVFSSARRDGERTLRPSTLIRHLPPRTTMPPQPKPPAWMLLQEIADVQGPPSAAAIVRGGVGVLKSQALCPFRAFAENRLGARRLETGELGVGPLDRGNALHKALELFWQATGSQARLKAMSTEELLSLVQRSAAEAIRGLPGGVEGSLLTQRFRELACERIEKALLEWLELEHDRPAPFAVERREEQRQVEIGGLELTARIDRVDRLENGGHVIIDYKTGAQVLSPNSWSGPRIEEPQLPLYAATAPETVTAVAFGQLFPGKMEFKGIAAVRDILPRVRPPNDGQSLGERIEDWRRDLAAVAKEFRSGYAAVDPKKGACEFCGLTALCRVAEAGVKDEDNSDAP